MDFIEIDAHLLAPVSCTSARTLYVFPNQIIFDHLVECFERVNVESKLSFDSEVHVLAINLAVSVVNGDKTFDLLVREENVLFEG